MADIALSLIEKELKTARARLREDEQRLRRLDKEKHRVSKDYARQAQVEANLNNAMEKLRGHPK